MGTCVSKCYPCFPCNNSISTAGISQPSPAVPVRVHREAAGAASPTTTSSSLSLSLSLVASTSLCASSSSSSSSASSSSSHYRRPRELALLPNATSSSMSSREWDVVVLDPKSKSPDSDPIISGSDRLATPTPKRPRSVSPLSARPAALDKQQQHKKKKKRREVVELAQPQARNKKAEVSQSLLRRRRVRVEADNSSSAHANSTTARVTAEDDLTNPIISMDCFIFL